MIIRRRRIRNVARYFPTLQHGTSLIVGIPVAEVTPQQLTEIGFPANPAVDTAILPPPNFGPASRFNANGKFDVHRNLPKITLTRSVYRSWTDWHGNAHSGYADVDYLCYPRTFVPPPSVELRVSATTQGDRIITTEPIVFEPANFAAFTHRINLLLDIFRVCHIFTDDLARFIQAPLQRLNWRILPPGARPYAQLQQQIAPILQRQPAAYQPTIRRRLETINALAPDFVAVGEAGFSGYVVFGFPNRNIFLLESIFIDNATYVFGDDWQVLSQRTKAEIIDNNLAQRRIFHRDGWHEEIARLFP